MQKQLAGDVLDEDLGFDAAFDCRQRVFGAYKRVTVGVIILTQQHKILLQRRDENAPSNAGGLASFGGAVDAGECMLEAVCRELREELEVNLDENALGRSLHFLGAGLLPGESGTFAGLFFWHDVNAEIGACHEGQKAEFDTLADVLSAAKRPLWLDSLLAQCAAKGLI